MAFDRSADQQAIDERHDSMTAGEGECTGLRSTVELIFTKTLSVFSRKFETMLGVLEIDRRCGGR